jgi:hypothetical protein
MDDRSARVEHPSSVARATEAGNALLLERDVERRPLRRVLVWLLLGVIPVATLAGMLGNLFANDLDTKAAFDLKEAFLPAAHAVVHGNSPYPLIGDASIAHSAAYVYPPIVAFVLTPLTAVSVSAASAIGILGSLVLIPVILALLDVRDWRCYGVVIYWSPVFNAVQNVNVSVPIALFVALAWRFRRSWLIAGASLGCAVAAKLFVWPFLIWPLACRRGRVVLMGVATAVALALGSWAAIGFKGLTAYPSLLRALTSHEETDSYSVSGVLRVLGMPVGPARGAAILLTAVLCALCLRFGRRGDDRRALTAAALAALASTPILWQHYLLLLLVVLPLARPRLSPMWFVPCLLWLAPTDGNGNIAQTMLVPLTVVVIGAVCLLPEGALSARLERMRERFVTSAPPAAGDLRS